MGFSVSGAAAIIFASMFIAFGAWYTAADNSFKQVNDAQDDKIEGALDASNTEIDITSATYNGTLSSDQLEIHVYNNGTTELSLNATDLLINGSLEQGWEPGASVASDGATDLWLPGEELVITLDRSEYPERVKLATETGVSNARTVEDITA
jgi:flagellar protein FlaF